MYTLWQMRHPGAPSARQPWPARLACEPKLAYRSRPGSTARICRQPVGRNKVQQSAAGRQSVPLLCARRRLFPRWRAHLAAARLGEPMPRQEN